MKFLCWIEMRHNLTEVLTNIRGGLTGVLIYLIITILVYFAAFMAALGNDTASARFVISIAETYAMVAHPLWAVPISYILGGIFFYTNFASEENIHRKE
jgi:hypothetical protein